MKGPELPMNRGIDLDSVRERLAKHEGPEYWKSLDEVAETEEFQEFLRKEFPRQAGAIGEGVQRRDFLKLLGASMALAGLSACARPPLPHEKIVPYVSQPESITPGKPLFFATAVTYGGYAEGVLAESHQGRPTKLEGNPDHPASHGATSAVTQAQVLDLYDPDRSQRILLGGQEAAWEDAANALRGAITALPDGAGLAVLTETVTSPTMTSQLAAMQAALPASAWYQYDAMHADNVVAGAALAFGAGDVVPIYDFSKADVVVSFDGDFMSHAPGKLHYSRAFADKRRVHTAQDTMNRLYQLEPTPSITGSLADHRIPLGPAEISMTAAAVAGALGIGAQSGSLPERVDDALFQAMVADLQANQGTSLVVAGASQPPAVHALAHAMNDALGNVGQTVSYVQSPEARPEVHTDSLRSLVDDINAGNVKVLVILGGNPVYDAPADLEFADALARVPLSLHLGLYRNETGRATTWHVPELHFLETWGDARAFDGTVTLRQPLILPFYGGKSDLEVMAALLGTPDATAYDLVRNYWQNTVSGSFDDFWRESVYAGVVAGSASPAAQPAIQSFSPSLPEVPELEIHFALDPSLLDGRYANNGWLQELPKPFTNLTWDNAVLTAPSTAERLGVKTGDMVRLTVGSRELAAPVWVHPGQAIHALTLMIGFGRDTAGKVGNGVGVNTNWLRETATSWSAPVQVGKTSDTYTLVTTQTHHNLEGTGERRHIVRDGTLAQFQAEPEHPSFVHPVHHDVSDLYPEFEYTSYRWGMVIDQNVCTGCNACVTACQAENNIPIVGKAQVAVGREMHWIRVDNYHKGNIDEPSYYHQPMPCQQCEKAPCEPVCPVGATTHDAEGLNVMVYNRCVGTRYCSNNCPYKVRRFNFLQYAELDTTETSKSLANNPDVTVRSRGVMEKCTYCQQRIAESRITALNEDRKIRDGEVVTACQAACPTEAIVFGDIGDPDARVTQIKASPLNHVLLEELNTYPRTSYLSKLRNPNPTLASASTTEGGN